MRTELKQNELKQYEQFLERYFCNEYELIIENPDETENTLPEMFLNYKQIIDYLFSDYSEEIYFLSSGCLSRDEVTIIKETGEHITVNYESPCEEILKYKDEIGKVLYLVVCNN